jgi:membrane protease YdiL (CAAX protease family)
MSTDSSSDSKPLKKLAKTAGQWGPMAAVVVVILGMVLGEIFGAMTIGLFIGFMNDGRDIASKLAATEMQFLYVLMSGLGSLLILWLFMRWRKIHWRSPGFNRHPKWQDLGWSGLVLPIYFIALIIVSSIAGMFLGVDINQEQEIGFNQVYGSTGLILTFISLVVIPPIVEEILFRGFLFTGLRTKLKFWQATAITSVLFAIPHLFASSHGLLWVAAIDTFILSLFLCYIRERTGNLWAPIALHAMKNGVAFAAIFIIGV